MPERFSFEEFLQRVNVIEKEVSKRKKLEGELRESEEWYETLAQLSPVGIFRTDADGRCLYVNRRWCEIAGLTPEEARGDGWVRGLHPEDRERVSAEWYEAAKNDAPFHAEYRFRSPEGVTTWVIGNARAVRGPGGRLLGYIGTITDITDRKAAEESFRAGEERLRTVVGLMPVMLDAFDADGNICAWNRECERVTGYTADEMVGNPRAMERLYPDPGYRQAMLEAWAARGNDYYDWEWNLTAKDGTVKTIAWSNISERFPIPGWATWGVGVDVTERTRAQNALRERVKELTCLYSLSRILESRDITREEVLERVLELIPPAWQFPQITCARIVFADQEYTTDPFRETAWKLASPILVRGKQAGTVEVCYLEQRPNAAEGPFLREERHLIDEIAVRLGEAMGRKRAQEDEVLIAELGAKNEELEQFAYTVSHDLKNPLLTIEGFVGLIDRFAARGEDDKVQACVVNVVDATERMGRRLDELLELSRLGRLISPIEEIAFGEVAREAVRMVEGNLAKSGVRVEIDPEFPVVCGDAARLREVLENLLDNAAKFMGSQPEPKVRVGVRRDGEEPVFFVQDNGEGIASEDQEKVFGLFTRLRSDAPGTGAGLTIVKRIIEAHRGRVWVESAGKGQGSRFCFTLGPMPRPGAGRSR